MTRMRSPKFVERRAGLGEFFAKSRATPAYEGSLWRANAARVSAAFTPAAGWRWLTPLYDRLVATFAREEVWRRALAEQIAPLADDVIADLGCGTGSMLIRLATAAPQACMLGIDPDRAILRQAHSKAAAAGVTLHLAWGLGSDAAGTLGGWRVTKLLSSLVLHQVPLVEKRAMLAAAHDLLMPGGELHIADYDRQANLSMRLLFRMTVQLVDGVTSTAWHVRGVLPELVHEAGFAEISETRAFNTPSGTIRLYRAVRR